MITVIVEAALRSLALAALVWLGVKILRIRATAVSSPRGSRTRARRLPSPTAA
jgi:hypothetical protein